MKQNWTYKKFEDCLDKVKYTPKVPSSDYMDDGAFPIISQEEGLISGYWNKETYVFKVLKPVVIFGDHTRILKYVDFDFVLGADGVKILQPIEGLSAKFLLYYLIWCNIPSMGYSRHYKLLKELDIPVPPIETQSRIVSELDLLQSIIDKQQAQLKELDTLAQAVFYDMFGDPVENEKGWEVIEMGELFEIGSSKRVFEAQWTESGVPFYRAREIVKLSKNEPIDSPIFISEELYQEYSKKYGVPSAGDMMVTAVGTLGVTYIVKASDKFYFKDGNTLWFKSKGLCETRFIKDEYSTNYVIRQIQGNANAAVVGTYTIMNAKNTKVVVPPISLQKKYVAIVESIEKQKAAIRQSIAETQKLFDYTMDKYFG